MTDLITALKAIVGATNVLTADSDRAAYEVDATHSYKGQARAVVRPASTQEVSEVVKLANKTKTPIIPQSGNTGLAGGCFAGPEGNQIILSLSRMNTIREIRPDSRIAIVQAGVVLAKLHEAVAQHDLIFPLTFGAQGSAMIGGNLATNAGGSNVLRYGNTRDLVLGIEAVLANGDIVDLMSELHKDNTGFNLKHLLIGSEGALGIITGAVLKLAPRPKAYFTAMVAVPSIASSLGVLNQLREATNNAVEAFEYMPALYFDMLQERFPETRMPFDTPAEHGIFLEVGLSAPDDVTPLPDGTLPAVNRLESLLMAMLEAGQIEDAVVCKSEAQRREMWTRRERAFETTVSRGMPVNNDISVAVDKVETFLSLMDTRLPAVFPKAQSMTVSHLGDGNLHYSVWTDPETRAPVGYEDYDRVLEIVEDTVLELGGSFSAEHGIGVTKLGSMKRRKNKPALAAMWAIKAALDPNNILNPGKVLPPQ